MKNKDIAIIWWVIGCLDIFLSLFFPLYLNVVYGLLSFIIAILFEIKGVLLKELK